MFGFLILQQNTNVCYGIVNNYYNNYDHLLCRGLKLCIVKEEKRKSSTSEQTSANATIITREYLSALGLCVELNLYPRSTLATIVSREPVTELETEA